MKLTFRGWSREKKAHPHVATPVRSKDHDYSEQPRGPLTWDSYQRVFAKLDGLGLSGDFLVEIELEEAELKSWLERFVDEKPERAIQVLARMQARAILALHRRPHTAESGAGELARRGVTPDKRGLHIDAVNSGCYGRVLTR